MKIFISHATEDKEVIAKPLADELIKRNIEVWYDEYSLELGDSLRRGIEKGLSECHLGVVILSKSFFDKSWTQRELDSLTSKEIVEKRKVIIPVWHEVGVDEVASYSLNLADKVAISSSKGVVKIASEITSILTQNKKKDTKSNLSTAEINRMHDEAEIMYMNGLILQEYISEYSELKLTEKMKWIQGIANMTGSMAQDLPRLKTAKLVLESVSSLESNQELTDKIDCYIVELEKGIELIIKQLA